MGLIKTKNLPRKKCILGLWGENHQQLPEQVSWKAAAVPCVSPALSQGRTGQGGTSAGPTPPQTWVSLGSPHKHPSAESQLQTGLEHLWATRYLSLPTARGKNYTWNPSSPRKRRFRATAPPGDVPAAVWTLGTLFPAVPKFFRGHKQVTSQAHTHSPCLLLAATSGTPLFRNNPFNQDLYFFKAN